jgi:hypothetical protein
MTVRTEFGPCMLKRGIGAAECRPGNAWYDMKMARGTRPREQAGEPFFDGGDMRASVDN